MVIYNDVLRYVGTLAHMFIVPHCNERDIKRVVSNNSIDQQYAVFCHHYLTLTETPSLHKEQKHRRESVTPHVLGLGAVISSIHIHFM